MNRLPCLALIACTALLSACASAPSANGESIVATGTYYCWQGRLHESNGVLNCNWATTTNEACEARQALTIAASRVSGTPTRARRCENGEWLVQVTTR